MNPVQRARDEHLRRWRRPVYVVVLVSLGVLCAFPGMNSAGSAGASFNAGVVWGDATGIYGANVDGSGVHRLVPRIADMHSGPAWSSSGDALVFSTRISDSVDLHILRPPAGTLHVLKLRSRWTSPRRAHVFSYVLPRGHSGEALVIARVEAQPGRLASLLEVVVAPGNAPSPSN